MDKTWALIFAIVVGFVASLQPVVNSKLGQNIGSKNAVFVNFLIGLFLIGLIILISDPSSIKQLSKVPSLNPVYLLGGIMGVIIVLLSLIVVPELGALSAFSIFVGVQLISGALIDHFGLFGLQKSPITLIKIFGILLLLVGMRILIK
ncbi:DMT family transporter [Methanococcus sp. CF]